MKKDLVAEVVELEEGILQLKKVQKTQNDSYKFYAYLTENLWDVLPHGGINTIIYLEFVPEMKTKDKVMCRLYAEDGSAVQYITRVEIDPYDHCKATFQFYGYDPPTAPPEFQRFAYVGCYTNCAGHLTWHT